VQSGLIAGQHGAQLLLNASGQAAGAAASSPMGVLPLLEAEARSHSLLGSASVQSDDSCTPPLIASAVPAQKRLSLAVRSAPTKAPSSIGPGDPFLLGMLSAA